MLILYITIVIVFFICIYIYTLTIQNPYTKVLDQDRVERVLGYEHQLFRCLVTSLHEQVIFSQGS